MNYFTSTYLDDYLDSLKYTNKNKALEGMYESNPYAGWCTIAVCLIQIGVQLALEHRNYQINFSSIEFQTLMKKTIQLKQEVLDLKKELLFGQFTEDQRQKKQLKKQ